MNYWSPNRWDQSLKNNAEFYIEYFAIDLIITDGACTGVVAWKLDDGTIHVFNAKMVVGVIEVPPFEEARG